MNKEIIKSNGSRLDDNAQEGIGHKGINSICGLIERIMSQGNSEVARASIEKLPIDIIDDFDTYLFKDDFQVRCNKKWKSPLTVFLFKNIIIFTKVNYFVTKARQFLNNFDCRKLKFQKLLRMWIRY